uniref:Uncharacterized protein n=1 Tax=Arundo donax TaxID=35708 RepID=A0A0A9HWZ7_ARUDO
MVRSKCLYICSYMLDLTKCSGPSSRTTGSLKSLLSIQPRQMLTLS